MTFAGKTAIVTGAARGIGRELAVQLSARGAIVLVTDLPGTGLEEVAAALGARAQPVDVTSREQLQAAVDGVVAEHGRLDYMFCNAGVAIFGDFEEVTLDDWDRIIDVNLRGVAYGAAIAYRQMVRQGHGHIVSTASVAGLVPVGLQAHYCATKHAVVGMSRTLALEARRHGITVTALCPAFVESGMFDDNTLRGALHGVDTRRLLPVRPLPTDCAVAAMLDGVQARKEMVIVPAYGRLSWWFERFTPAVATRVHRLLLGQLRRRAKRLRRR